MNPHPKMFDHFMIRRSEIGRAPGRAARVSGRAGVFASPPVASSACRKSVLAPVTLLIGLALSSAAPAQRALNDTGTDTCYNATVSTGAVEPATHPRQDCRIGRDAAQAAGVLNKSGAGTKGFDFTKIANNGSMLPASAALGTSPADWGCTYDNITGLSWEVKTTIAANLRYWGNTYSWFNSDAARNGGNPGGANWGSCSGGINCDTQSYVAAVNSIQLCGHSDWRMPSVQELQSLVDYSQPYGGNYPSIDVSYFPYAKQYPYWTGINYAANPASAYYVYFDGGFVVENDKYTAVYVRLVRTGP